MSSVNTVVAPAGWYPDPLGLPQVRWWNGLSWTNRIEEMRPDMRNGSRHSSAGVYADMAS
ncbi:MAG: hypothetical protein JWO10_684 [Microbacteriaceae bacterium]|nr:hypothetical protein [Microbacteriaceae bacterium]